MNAYEVGFLPPLPPVLEVRITEGPVWLRVQVGRMVSRPFREVVYDSPEADRPAEHRDDPRRTVKVFRLLGFGPTEQIARAMAAESEVT